MGNFQIKNIFTLLVSVGNQALWTLLSISFHNFIIHYVSERVGHGPDKEETFAEDCARHSNGYEKRLWWKYIVKKTFVNLSWCSNAQV